MNFNHVKNGFYISDDSKFALILPSEVMLHLEETIDGVNYFRFHSQPLCRISDGNNIINSVDYRSIFGDIQYIIDTINQLVSPGYYNYVYYDLANINYNFAFVRLVNNPPRVIYESIFEPHYGFLYNVDEFTTNLYSELLDNTEQTNEVKAYISNPDPQTLPVWSQDEKNLIDFVEKYNKNVLLLRSTRKVNIENTVSTSSSSSSVNLSGVENELQNINNNLTNLNNKFEIEKTVDDETVYQSITEVIDEKSSDNPIVVSSEDLSPWSPV